MEEASKERYTKFIHDREESNLFQADLAPESKLKLLI